LLAALSDVWKQMRCAHAIGTMLLAAAGALLVACDDPDEDSCRGIDPIESALFGAGTDAGSMDGEGVVGLLVPIGARGTQLCSGTLIAPNVVLTARHCLGPDLDPEPDPDPSSSRRARAHVGMTLQGLQQPLPIRAFIGHDERDIALAVIDRPPGLRDLTVLALAFDDEIRVGDRATLAGYGLDENGDAGERRFVEESVVDVDDELVVVDGAGESGACTGDSGGPLLLRTVHGELRVAGVLSVGSASCTELDVYQRVAPVEDWLNEELDRIADELAQELERANGGGC
jgi:Trypsin